MPQRAPKRPRSLPTPAVPALVTLAVSAFLVAGCGGGPRSSSRSVGLAVLVVGRRGASPEDARDAVSLARRFATVYARGAYLAHPPRLPGEARRVRRALAAAAGRVPPGRRGLRPRLAALRLRLGPGGAVVGTAWIEDGRHPAFSVGFTVSRRGGRRLVTSISLPD